MPELNDPEIDELRNREGQFFGKAPVQGWPRPISVSVHRPTVELFKRASEMPRPTLRDLIEGKAKVKVYREGLMMDFVVAAPWALPVAPAGYVKPAEQIFEKFLCLESASHSDIHAFASKYGPLMVFCSSEPTEEKKTEIIHEFSEVWRYFAGCMKALLRISASLHARRRPNHSDWDAIGGCPLPVKSARYRLTDADVLNPLILRPEEMWSAMTFFIAAGEHRDRDMLLRLLNCLLALGHARLYAPDAK